MKDNNFNYIQFMQRNLRKITGSHPLKARHMQYMVTTIDNLFRENLMNSIRIQNCFKIKNQKEHSHYDNNITKEKQLTDIKVTESSKRLISAGSFEKPRKKVQERMGLQTKLQIKQKYKSCNRKELFAYKKRSEYDDLKNPFHKIMKKRTLQTSLNQITTNDLKADQIELEDVKKTQKIEIAKNLKTEPDDREINHIQPIREKSVTVKYQQIKNYFQEKYGKKV